MIKINLLESIADRPTGAAMVEARVTSPRVQTMLMALTVFGLFFVGAGYDYISSRSAHAAATTELNNQKLINQQMLAVNNEKAELEKKVNDIQGRIDAIKKLRESQQGPSAVLREIKARFDAVPGLYLRTVEQKEGELTITGLSPNEASVTRFGQSMEFSSGLFSNLNIETQRELVQAEGTAAKPAGTDKTAATDKTVATTEVVAFTLKCNYGSKSESKQANKTTPKQVAKK